MRCILHNAEDCAFCFESLSTYRPDSADDSVTVHKPSAVGPTEVIPDPNDPRRYSPSCTSSLPYITEELFDQFIETGLMAWDKETNRPGWTQEAVDFACCLPSKCKKLSLPGETVTLSSGEPCSHPGCLSHVSHPCEGCGRIEGRGEVTISSNQKG